MFLFYAFVAVCLLGWVALLLAVQPIKLVKVIAAGWHKQRGPKITRVSFWRWQLLNRLHKDLAENELQAIIRQAKADISA